MITERLVCQVIAAVRMNFTIAQCSQVKVDHTKHSFQILHCFIRGPKKNLAKSNLFDNAVLKKDFRSAKKKNSKQKLIYSLLPLENKLCLDQQTCTHTKTT